VTLACVRLLSGQPTPSFSIERGETAPAAESATDEASAQGEKDAAEEAPSNGPPVVVVHVDGMVANPGVYQLQVE
jgi:competence protein ComEA